MKIPVLRWSVAMAMGMPLFAQAAPPAAVVSKIVGNAVATQGERYVTVHDGMRLVEGDRLMVLEGGQAVVTFNDGCRLDLPEMAILSVQADSTCALESGGDYQLDAKSGVASGKSSKAQLAAIGPNAVATGSSTAGPPALLGGTTMFGPTVPTIALAVGALAVAGGVTAAAVNSSKSNDNSTPPVDNSTPPVSP